MRSTVVSTPDAATARLPLRPVIGYACVSDETDAVSPAGGQQAEQIMRACDARGLRLIELVADRRRPGNRAQSRPALDYALGRIEAREVGGLVVADLSRLASSAVELGRVIQALDGMRATLIAANDGLDTSEDAGRLAAALLVEVSFWERRRLSERTRRGIEAARRSGRATGPASVRDYPDLRRRIEQMRADGMTLQAIAERFNAEGVPTIRGGSQWRHSSLQAVLGYRRGRLGSAMASPGADLVRLPYPPRT